MSRLHSRRMKRHTAKTDKLTQIIMWAIPIAMILWLLWAQNNLLVTKTFIYGDSDLPKAFVGYHVVHISDLCNTSIDVVSKVSKLKPDIIVISGGYFDSNGNSNNSVSTVSRLCQIAPVYYITNSSDKSDPLSSTQAVNITGSTVEIHPIQKDVSTFITDNYGSDIINKANNGDEKASEYIKYVSEALTETASRKINIIGIRNYDSEDGAEQAVNDMYSLLDSIDKTDLNFALLGNLQYLDKISKSNLDTIFLGGTFGTDRISDEYKKGTKGMNGTQLFISGGVGNDGTVSRIFNFPEIQYITLSDGTIHDENPLENFISLFYNDVGTVFDNDGGFTDYVYEY